MCHQCLGYFTGHSGRPLYCVTCHHASLYVAALRLRFVFPQNSISAALPSLGLWRQYRQRLRIPSSAAAEPCGAIWGLALCLFGSVPKEACLARCPVQAASRKTCCASHPTPQDEMPHTQHATCCPHARAAVAAAAAAAARACVLCRARRVAPLKARRESRQ